MKKVLIIDNDRDTLYILGEIAKMSMAEVVLRSNVIPIKEIEEINPGLIFLDHLLGLHLGGDFCLEIKQNEATKEIPVILFSCQDGIGKIAMDSWADGALEKPFELDEILAVIDTHLN
ncbi:MAG: response regulator [Bacteroidota bacterium]|nr:response regulator [Bacteroidota bacterium]